MICTLIVWRICSKIGSTEFSKNDILFYLDTNRLKEPSQKSAKQILSYNFKPAWNFLMITELAVLKKDKKDENCFKFVCIKLSKTQFALHAFKEIK